MPPNQPTRKTPGTQKPTTSQPVARKATTSQPAARKATTSQPAAQKTTTSRSIPQRRQVAPPKKQTGLYIGVVVGLVAMIVVMSMVMGGHEDGPKKKSNEPSADETDASKPQWERMAAEGKRKTGEAIEEVKAKSTEMSGFAKLPADKRMDLLNKLGPIIEAKKVGLSKYEQAVGMSGGKLTKANYDALLRDWETACSAIVKSLEREGVSGCEKGYATLNSSRDKWTNEVPKAQQHEVHALLRDGIDTIKAGMACLSWINELNGGTFETRKYGEIMKLAINKVKELE